MSAKRSPLVIHANHRPLSVILMRSRVAEINQYAIAHVSRDATIEPIDNFRHGAVIGCDDLA
jgi:hypothetical protein